jgi:hypothetical protein
MMFVRHRSGPLYYMYVGAPTHFLRKRRDEQGQPGMDVHDIVVDDHAELLWRLRACYGLKNLLGKRIVAIGDAGGWGADGRGPDRAREPGSWTLSRFLRSWASGFRRRSRTSLSCGGATPKLSSISRGRA